MEYFFGFAIFIMVCGIILQHTTKKSIILSTKDVIYDKAIFKMEIELKWHSEYGRYKPHGNISVIHVNNEYIVTQLITKTVFR